MINLVRIDIQTEFRMEEQLILLLKTFMKNMASRCCHLECCEERSNL